MYVITYPSRYLNLCYTIVISVVSNTLSNGRHKNFKSLSKHVLIPSAFSAKLQPDAWQ